MRESDHCNSRAVIVVCVTLAFPASNMDGYAILNILGGILYIRGMLGGKQRGVLYDIHPIAIKCVPMLQPCAKLRYTPPCFPSKGSPHEQSKALNNSQLNVTITRLK